MANVEAVQGLEDVQKVLADMAKRFDNLKPFMSEAINIVKNRTEESFEKESAPDGTPWTPLKNPRDGKILHKSGDMEDSLWTDADKRSATIGFSMKSEDGYAYPAVHQFGTENGRIPARPFLPIRPDGELMDDVVREIMEVFTEIANLN